MTVSIRMLRSSAKLFGSCSYWAPSHLIPNWMQYDLMDAGQFDREDHFAKKTLALLLVNDEIFSLYFSFINTLCRLRHLRCQQLASDILLS